MDHHAHSASADAELLSRTASGDPSAYAELWQRHHRAGLTAARSLAPQQDPGDLVSEAFTRILALVQDGRGPQGAFRPYMYQVIKALGADWSRRPESSAEEMEDFPDPDDAGPWREASFDRDATVAAFASLSERWQSVLWYTEVEGMRPREVAKLLGVSANTASALALRAKNALRSAWVEAHLSADHGDPACQAALKDLQRYDRGKLTAAASRSVESHLEECESCRGALAELSRMNRQLALVLVGLAVGITAAPGLLTALAPATPAAVGTLSGVGAVSAGGTKVASATLLAAAAASVAIVLGAGAILIPGGPPLQTPANATSDERRGSASTTDASAGSTTSDTQRRSSDARPANDAVTTSSENAPMDSDPYEPSTSEPTAAPESLDTVTVVPPPETTPDPEPQVVTPVAPAALVNPQCRSSWTGEGSQMITAEGTATHPGTVVLQVTVPGRGTQTMSVATTGAEGNWWHSPALTVPLDQLPAGVTFADVVVTAQLVSAANGTSAPLTINTGSCQ